MAYHVNQDYPPIILDTKVDITSATEYGMLYKKPSGLRGKWIGALDGTTRVSYTPSKQDLNEKGIWKLQSYVIINGGQAIGDVVDLVVKESLLELRGL